MPMAVRCAPGIGCAFNPSDSTLSHTARTCSGVACACITISMGWAPENVSLTDLLTRQALRGNPFKTGVPGALGSTREGAASAAVWRRESSIMDSMDLGMPEMLFIFGLALLIFGPAQ